MATGYHLLPQEALPSCFWQHDEDEETNVCLDVLQRSFERYGLCWVIWDKQNEAFYERRDLYRCQIVPCLPHDIVDRGIPFGDLRDRSACPIFFSSERIRDILAMPGLARHPEVEKARAFIASVFLSDEPDVDPVGHIDIAVPVAAFQEVVDRVRSRAARHGLRAVQLQRHILFLKAALHVLNQRAGQELDMVRRRVCLQQRAQLQRVLQQGEKTSVFIEWGSSDSYIVHVGLFPSMYQYQAA